MNLLRRAIALFLFLSMSIEPTKGEPKEYDGSQVFVIDVLGTCFTDFLIPILRPVVNAAILPIFKRRFGPFDLLYQLSDILLRRTDRSLVPSCPSNCNLNQQTRSQCVAMNCVSQSGARRRRLDSYDNCFTFDADATRIAMNRMLRQIGDFCNITLTARVKTLEDYNSESPPEEPPECPLVLSCILSDFSFEPNKPHVRRPPPSRVCMPSTMPSSNPSMTPAAQQRILNDH